ncbi:NAD(P)/FAD-dependent oxidoreductase [Streptomyces marincola]|uniref:NAD(P)/FAD-dependent oxidoreductase n=1 Tax=Streptomyces marincola TaxID=2878388 RepID=UPI0021F2F9BE|nr:FAD-binding oxidoreductase [Streptomyces marincola]
MLADHRGLEEAVPGYAVRRTGSLTWPAPDGEERAALGGAHGEAGPVPGSRRVTGAEVAALEPRLLDVPAYAVHTPSDAGVDPVAATRALVAAARAHGARVVHDASVTAVDTVRGRVKGVSTAAGFLPAGTVVLAAGTGTRALCEPLGIDLPVAVSPACLLEVAAPAGSVNGIVATPEFEVREVRPGRLLVVAPCPADGPVPPARVPAESTMRRLRAAFRGGAGWRLLDCRVGARPVPARGPVIGHLTRDRSLYTAVLHSAVTLAPTVGRLVAGELLGHGPACELRDCRPGGPA